jgi:hypothetical protein
VDHGLQQAFHGHGVAADAALFEERALAIPRALPVGNMVHVVFALKVTVNCSKACGRVPRVALGFLDLLIMPESMRVSSL